MGNPEHLQGTESTAEQQKAASERSSELAKQVERQGEPPYETKTERVDSARREAKEILSKESGKEVRSGGEPTIASVRKVTKHEREASYQATMKHVRSEMSAPARAFSKLIHIPAVERSSEVLGSSFARPNAILAGSVSAFFLVMGVYIVARTFGYRLSGFETIGAFIVGWAIGLIYDFVRIMAFGRRE